jgi:hypothetical protein
MMMLTQRWSDRFLTDDFLANSCSFAMQIFFFACWLLKMGTLSELSVVRSVISKELEREFRVPSLLLTWVMTSCVLGAVSIAFSIFLVQLAQERARMLRDRAKQRMPTCDWCMAADQSYVCFLSHFKIEAGAACRYLKDNFDNMLGNPVYLDSSNLADLHVCRDRTRDCCAMVPARP